MLKVQVTEERRWVCRHAPVGMKLGSAWSQQSDPGPFLALEFGELSKTQLSTAQGLAQSEVADGKYHCEVTWGLQTASLSVNGSEAP